MKFTSLLANLVIFHNILDIADVVWQLQAEGWEIDPLDLAEISPYLTEYINRFGSLAGLTVLLLMLSGSFGGVWRTVDHQPQSGALLDRLCRPPLRLPPPTP